MSQPSVLREGAALRYGGELAWLGEAAGRVQPRASDRAWVLARATVDAVALACASYVSNIEPTIGVAWHTALVLLTLGAFAAAGAYVPTLRLHVLHELRTLLSTSALAFMLVAATVIIATPRDGVGDATLEHWLAAAGLLSAGRVVLYGAQRVWRSRLGGAMPTLIVGAGQVGQLTAKRLLAEPQLGLAPIGYLDKEPLASGDAHEALGMPALPVLGASWDLEQVVRAQGVEHVVVAFSTAPHHVLLGIVRKCWSLGVGVSLVPRLYEVEGRRFEVEHLGGLPLVGLTSADPRGPQFAVKYAIDRIVAALMLLVLSPVLAAVALGVAVSMGRPIFFRQQRVGRDGHVFSMYKFRTMRGAPSDNGEADAGWASLVLSGIDVPSQTAPAAADDRRTPLGALLRKLSLDELPQLWNVLVGDMSLVGPRPERVHYVTQFEDVVYRYPDRHRVKSGLTGWAQVHGLRGETSLADRVEWDNFYIENWSPWLDLKILFMTVPALLGRRPGR